MNQYSISFAGAGRVASALCRELYHCGSRIDLVVSESENSSRKLAESCNSSWSTELRFPDSTNIVIVAVPDHRLKSVLGTLKCAPDTLVAHTAGSMDLDIFPHHIRNKAVFYPLQTFSKGRKIVFNDLPVFLESSDNKSSEVLQSLAESIKCKIYFADTEHRRILHLAAVFVCNFTNHMLTEGKEVALKAGFPFEILVPLIKETISKAIETGPENSQTGPSVRNDQNTIEKHMELLSYSVKLQRIYSEMTKSIIDYYDNKDKRHPDSYRE